MRDPKRIPKVLKELEKTWKASPDLRLGQLIVNILGEGLGLFYIEDDKAVKAIKNFRDPKQE